MLTTGKQKFNIYRVKWPKYSKKFSLKKPPWCLHQDGREDFLCVKK